MRLKELGAKVYVISRPKEQIFSDKVKNYYPLNSQNIIEAFADCGTIINTIPYNVIPEEALNLKNMPYILDIASFPYGISEDIVKKYKDKINYKLYLGIPSKFAPKEASRVLLKILEKEVIKK